MASAESTFGVSKGHYVGDVGSGSSSARRRSVSHAASGRGSHGAAVGERATLPWVGVVALILTLASGCWWAAPDDLGTVEGWSIPSWSLFIAFIVAGAITIAVANVASAEWDPVPPLVVAVFLVGSAAVIYGLNDHAGRSVEDLAWWWWSVPVGFALLSVTLTSANATAMRTLAIVVAAAAIVAVSPLGTSMASLIGGDNPDPGVETSEPIFDVTESVNETPSPTCSIAAYSDPTVDEVLGCSCARKPAVSRYRTAQLSEVSYLQFVLGRTMKVDDDVLVVDGHFGEQTARWIGDFQRVSDPTAPIVDDDDWGQIDAWASVALGITDAPSEPQCDSPEAPSWRRSPDRSDQ